MGLQDRDYWKEDSNNPKPRQENAITFKTILSIIAAIIIGGIFLWFARIAIIGIFLNSMQKTANNAIMNIQTQSLESSAKIHAQIQENQIQQKQREQAIEAERIANLPPMQREELRRNQLWKQQYSPPKQCINTANAYMIGECIKHEKNARVRFENSLNGKEEYWAKYYTPTAKCLQTQSALQELECNNEKNNTRKYFERDWQTKINNGWRPSPLN